MLRHLGGFAIAVELGVFSRDGNDFMVFFARVNHRHQPNGARINNGERHNGFLAQHQHVERIFIFRQRLWNKAVIRGIVNR